MVKPVEPIQGMLDFGENPEKPQRGKAGPSKFDEVMERVNKEKAEADYFKDKRVKASPLVAESELARMKEILNMPKSGGGGGAGAESGFGIQKMNKNLNRNYKAGGKVSAASKRADGCAVKGKTKGRIV